jgi:hypothetical protein
VIKELSFPQETNDDFDKTNFLEISYILTSSAFDGFIGLQYKKGHHGDKSWYGNACPAEH